MRAVTWQGTRDVSVENVADPTIEQPTDAIVRITSTGICGSDLHLYEVMSPFLDEGDVLGHEPMGVIEEVGSQVTAVAPGDRVVMPFQLCCGTCFMCGQGLHAQCETTQVRDQRMGAALFGYTKLYGQVPGAQAEYLRVPHANFMPIRVPEEPPDDRFVYLSDVVPTAWQAVEYADIPEGGTVAVLGLGPIGEMAARIAAHRGHRVLGVDLVPERLHRAGRYGVETFDLRDHDELAAVLQDATDGRGPSSVIDAVDMEAHGSPVGKAAQQVTSVLPDSVSQPMMEHGGVDRLNALYLAIDAVRRGGVISLIGVYGGTADPLPMLTLFDKQLTIRQGQANVKRWIDDIMPLITEESDPLGVEGFATHHLPLEDASHGYEIFQKKQDDAMKVVLNP